MFENLTPRSAQPEIATNNAAAQEHSLFDALAIRLDGPRSWDADITIRWNGAGDRPHTQHLRNGVLTHIAGTGPAAGEPDVEVALAEADLRNVLLGSTTPTALAERGRAEITGGAGLLATLFGYLSDPDPDFAIVTP